eukprot:794740-Lingulodinium_polyedra.AAC.1
MGRPCTRTMYCPKLAAFSIVEARMQSHVCGRDIQKSRVYFVNVFVPSVYFVNVFVLQATRLVAG